MTRVISFSNLWIYVVVTTMCLPTQTAFGRIIKDVTLRLIADESDANQFDLIGHVNTLTPALGTLSADGSATLSGEVLAVLNLEENGEAHDLTVQGIRFEGGKLDQSAIHIHQSPIHLDFRHALITTGTGMIEFDTNGLDAELESTNPNEIDSTEMNSTDFMFVENGEFAAISVRLTQRRGEATISVPEKPPEIQDLATFKVDSVYGPEITPVELPMGAVEVTLLGIEQGMAAYQVDLVLPLGGQSLLYEEVGLPTNVTYMDGEIKATGIIIIPEPDGFLMSMLVIGCSLAARSTRYRRPG